jgi:hypothetical protein
VSWSLSGTKPATVREDQEHGHGALA